MVKVVHDAAVDEVCVTKMVDFRVVVRPKQLTDVVLKSVYVRFSVTSIHSLRIRTLTRQ